MTPHWYPFDIEAWRRHTRHLTLAEKGAYRELIDEYISQAGPLPDNDRALGVICGAVDEWQTVRANVRAFFKIRDGKLHHARCDEEIEKLQRHASRRHAKAMLAANKRWQTNKNHATGMLGAMLGNATLSKKDYNLPTTEPRDPLVDKSNHASAPQRGATERQPMNGLAPSRELIKIAAVKGWSLPNPSERSKQ